jgi:hypothetical protein
LDILSITDLSWLDKMLKNLYKILFSTSVLLIALCITVSAQQKGKIVSGDYENLLIGVNAQGELTGYFDEGTGDDGNGDHLFTCTFFIYGEKETGGIYKVKTWYPEFPDDVIEGELKFIENGGKKSVNMHLDGEHGGCWNVTPGLKKKEGVDFELSSTGSFESVRMISPKRVYLFKSFDAKATQKIYIVKNDAVRVLQTKGDRAEIDFVNDNGRTTKGWMKTKDFYALAP